jgi:mannose-1-phosphate guanylyltransferase
MNALLLAAGEGRRLRPLTLSMPKCLAPILGKPLLGVWLDLLSNCPEVDCCWVNTSYLADQVRAFIEQRRPTLNFPVNLFHEESLLGTAGTLKALIPKLMHDDLLLVHADNLSWFSLETFLAAHRRRPAGTELTMMTFNSDSPQTCGIVELDDLNVVRSFHEKVIDPPSNLANGAVYLISVEGLAQIKNMKGLFEFSTQVIPAFLGKIFCWHNEVYHRDIGNPQAYLAAQAEFRSLIDQFR